MLALIGAVVVTVIAPMFVSLTNIQGGPKK